MHKLAGSGPIHRPVPTEATSRKLRRLAFTTALLLPLACCADPNAPPGSGQKAELGGGIGALVGGGLGAAFGRGNGRIITSIAGAGLGYFLGRQVGAVLDAQDRAALVAQQQEALLSQPDQQPVAWTSDHSSATATITPTNTHVERKTIKIIRQADVAEPTDLEAIGARYEAKASTRIHTSPDQKSASNGTLARGDHIWTVGRVRGEPWLLVARGGKSVGYVSSIKVIPVVHPAEYAAAAAAASPIATRGSSAPAGAAYDLDAADAVVRQPADLDAPQNGDKVDLVSADVTCRDLRTDASAGGKTDSTTKTACRSPDGAWQLD